MTWALPRATRIAKAASALVWTAIVFGVGGLIGFCDQYATAVEALIKCPTLSHHVQVKVLLARGELIFSFTDGVLSTNDKWKVDFRRRNDVRNIDYAPFSLSRMRSEFGGSSIELRLDLVISLFLAASAMLLRWLFLVLDQRGRIQDGADARRPARLI